MWAGTDESLAHTEARAKIATIAKPIAAPVRPSSNRSIPLVSPGTYTVATRIAETAA